MRLPGVLRRHAVPDPAAPTWQDNRPGRDSGSPNGRYLDIPQIDRWRAMPFDMPPDPERSAVMERVRQLVGSLDGAADEGTGTALDRLIESWVAAWIHTVEVSYADHCAVISVHCGQAAQWLAESTRTAHDEDEELERIRDAYLACRRRLAGETGPDTAGTARTPARI